MKRDTLFQISVALLATALGYVSHDDARGILHDATHWFSRSPSAAPGLDSSSPSAITADRHRPNTSSFRAFEHALKNRDFPLRAKALRKAYELLLPDEYAFAADSLYLHRADHDPYFDTLLCELLGDWASTDPAAAIAWVDCLPPHQKVKAIREITIAWAEVDLPAALAWIEQRSADQGARDATAAAKQGILTRLAATDLEKALSYYQEKFTLSEIDWDSPTLSILIRANPHAVFSLIAQTREETDLKAAIKAFMKILMEDDRSKAAAFITALPVGPHQFNAAEAFLDSSGDARRPSELIRMLYAMGGGYINKTMLSRLVGPSFENWVKTDPAAASHWYYEEFQQADPTLLSQFLPLQAKSDPEGAMAAALSLPDDYLRSELLPKTLAQWLARDPDRGFEWLRENEDLITPQHLLGTAAQLISPRDSHENTSPLFPQVATLASYLPAGEKQDDLYHSLAGYWADKSPDDAEAWIAEIPPGPAWDSAVRSFITTVGQKELSAASPRLDTLADDALKQRIVTDLAIQWGIQKNKPDLALEWLETNGYAEQQKKTIDRIREHQSQSK